MLLRCKGVSNHFLFQFYSLTIHSYSRSALRTAISRAPRFDQSTHNSSSSSSPSLSVSSYGIRGGYSVIEKGERHLVPSSAHLSQSLSNDAKLVHEEADR